MKTVLGVGLSENWIVFTAYTVGWNYECKCLEDTVGAKTKGGFKEGRFSHQIL